MPKTSKSKKAEAQVETVITTTRVKRTFKSNGTIVEEKIVETRNATPEEVAQIAAGDFPDIVTVNVEIKDLKQFHTECLDKHNDYRKKHGVDLLVLDETLNKYAQEWADVGFTIIILIAKGKMEHRQEGKFGENIYFAQNFQITGESPVIAWYNEIKDYDFSTNKMEKNTGHFTQLIWKNSKKLGVGVAVKGADVYVVTNYDPPGNWASKYTECVLKPK